MVWVSGPQGQLAPALVALFRQADAGWPNRSRLSDGSLGDTAHATRTSDHNPKIPNPPGWVDAGDLTRDDVRGPNIDRLWSYLISKRDPRVKYAIHRGRIVKSYVDGAGNPAWVPQIYTGSSPHTQHIHISVTSGGRLDTSPWFPPAALPIPAPASQEDDDMPVHYKPEGHADTGATFLVQGNVRWIVPNAAYNAELASAGYPEKPISAAAWDCIRNVTTLNIDGLLDGGQVTGLSALSDEDVAHIATAVNDEMHRRSAA